MSADSFESPDDTMATLSMFNGMEKAWRVPNVQDIGATPITLPEGTQDRLITLASSIGKSQEDLQKPLTLGDVLALYAAIQHNKLHRRVGRAIGKGARAVGGGLVTGGKAAGRGIATGGKYAVGGVVKGGEFVGKGVVAGGKAVGKRAQAAYDTITSEEAKEMYKQIGSALILHMDDKDSFLRKQFTKLGNAMETARKEINDFFTNEDRLGGKAIKAIKGAFTRLGTAIKDFFESVVGPTIAAGAYKVKDVMQDIGIAVGRAMQDAADHTIAAAKKAGVTMKHGVGKAALAAASGLLKEGVTSTVTHSGKTAKEKRAEITKPDRSSARAAATAARQKSRAARNKRLKGGGSRTL